jgi:hypothetical protein
MQEMASLINGKSLILGLLAVLIIALNACEEPKMNRVPPDKDATEFVDDVGFQRKSFISDSLQMEASIGQVVFKGEGEHGRIIFEKGVHVFAKNSRSEKLMELKANTGIVIFPYEEINLGNVWLESNDGTEFEADKLEWHRQEKDFPVLLRGEVRIITPKLILEGDSLKADVLLGGFEMRKITAVIDLE